MLECGAELVVQDILVPADANQKKKGSEDENCRKTADYLDHLFL